MWDLIVSVPDLIIAYLFTFVCFLHVLLVRKRQSNKIDDQMSFRILHQQYVTTNENFLLLGVRTCCGY